MSRIPDRLQKRPKPIGNQSWEVALRLGTAGKTSNPVAGKTSNPASRVSFRFPDSWGAAAPLQSEIQYECPRVGVGRGVVKKVLTAFNTV